MITHRPRNEIKYNKVIEVKESNITTRFIDS